MITITFEDHGQDFEYWIVDDDGHVRACGPFQQDIWTKFRVDTVLGDAKVGDKIQITHQDGSRMEIKYPLAKIQNSMRAGAALKKFGKKLLNRLVLTIPAGDYKGGITKILKIKPDKKAPEIAFTVQNGEDEIGVFEYEPIMLLT